MKLNRRTFVIGGLFAFGMAMGMLPARPARAEEAARDLQCWHFWWQEPQCTFCASTCFGADWDCCRNAPAT